MKRIILSLLLVASNYSLSQSKVDLPLKNDMIIFQAEHTLENKSKCLSSYFDMVGSSFALKLMPVTSQVFKSGNLSSAKYSGILSLLHDQTVLNCADTISGTSMLFNCNVPLDFKLANHPELAKRKILSQSVKSSIQIIFLSKSSYLMKFKGFIYTCTYSEDGTLVNKEFSLDEMYLQYKSGDSDSKQQHNFYSDLKTMILESQRIIQETLVKSCKTDDL